MSVRTVIVDDHALVSAGLEAVLADQANGRFDVVGTTTRADEAADLVTRTSADLALVDLHMPAPGGHAAIREILAARPSCRAVALSGEAGLPAIIAALAAGAVAFLPKTLGPRGLIAPLMTILDGGAVVPAALIERLATRFEDTAPVQDAPALDGEELRLLALLCHGAEIAEIADELGMSLSTAKRRLAALEDRMGVAGRAPLAHLAGWYRLVDPA